MKAYLLSGASGFLGRHLRQALPDNDTLAIAYQHANATDLRCDLSDRQAVLDLPTAESVIHLGGISGIPAFEADPGQGWAINLSGTLNLLEHARRSGARRFIFASTYVYGPPQYLPVDENHPLLTPHAYHRSKRMAEQVCEDYAQTTGLEIFILRTFNVYGPWQSRQMLIPTILEQLTQSEIVLRDPSPCRDFLYVTDWVQAILNILQLPFTETSQPHYFNLGSGQSISVSELVDLIQTQAQTELPVTYTHELRSSEVSVVQADIRKAQALLGWQPEVSLAEGIGLLCAS